MRLSLGCSLLIGMLVLEHAVLAQAPPRRGIAVIMAEGSPVSFLSSENLALIFKRKRNFWDNGERIQPVNLPPAHPLRRAFSQQVLGRSPEELDDYWRDMYFHGVLPPFVLASEEAVIRFVATTPGAIGYVSACALDHRVTVVLRLDEGPVCARQGQ
jgi:ABC-type phosphate transport system substrate-binding protein